MQNVIYIGLLIYLTLNILSLKFSKIITITTVILPINYLLTFYIYKEMFFYSMSVVFFIHFLIITLLSTVFIYRIYKGNRTTETIESPYGFYYTISKSRVYILLISLILLCVINYATNGFNYKELIVTLIWLTTIFFIGNSSYYYNIVMILLFIVTMFFIQNNRTLVIYCCYLTCYEAVVTLNYAIISTKYKNNKENKNY